MRPSRSETIPAGIAITILARLAAAHTSGTQCTESPALVAHSTTKTSGTLASASQPAATIIARSRPCSERQENDARGGATNGCPRGRPNASSVSTSSPGTTDARKTCLSSTCSDSSANAINGPMTAPA